jgi:hypothetical protein
MMKKVRIGFPNGVYYGIMNLPDNLAEYVVRYHSGVILEDLGSFKYRKGKKLPLHEPDEKEFLIEQNFNNLMEKAREFSRELEDFVEEIEKIKKRLIGELK